MRKIRRKTKPPKRLQWSCGFTPPLNCGICCSDPSNPWSNQGASVVATSAIRSGQPVTGSPTARFMASLLPAFAASACRNRPTLGQSTSTRCPVVLIRLSHDRISHYQNVVCLLYRIYGKKYGHLQPVNYIQITLPGPCSDLRVLQKTLTLTDSFSNLRALRKSLTLIGPFPDLSAL